MPTIAILGAGAWGTAMALAIAQKPAMTVRLWCAQASTGRELIATRENARLLPGVRIPDSIQLTLDPAEATRGADGWLVAIPTAFLRKALQPVVGFYRPETAVVSLSKGIENETFLRPTEIFAELFGASRLAVLSGPSHAEEVARGLPTSIVAASPDSALAAQVQDWVSGDRLRVYTNSDLIGVELAGALKNILGIGAGICDGLGFGDNAKSALLTRGLVEMQRFGMIFGANPETFFGLAGLGDVMTTCFSRHGRNRKVGERLAKGEPLDAIVNGPQVAAGVYTAKSAYERSRRAGLDAPILAAVYKVLYEGLNPLNAVQELFGRPQKREV